MTNKNKKRLLLGLCCALVASTFPVGFSACFTSGGDSSNSSTSEMQTEKYEGSFYADKEGGEGIYELAFTEDGVITYSEGGNKKIGTFVKADKEFLIAFNDGTTASAELVNKNILFTYGDLKITFIEKIEYTVTFNVDGATTKVTKYNGQQVAAPEAPEKTGYKFVGWYMDQKYTKPYVFATPVTKDVTLYARFIEVDENAEVFTVNFVVDGKAYGEPVQTEAGIVAELPTPTKEGATFAGWWMSGSNEEAKLTAKYDGQMIQEDITLFAVWASDAPAVSVSEKGVVWTAAGQNNNYKVEITKPDGTKKSATLADNYYDYDFTAEVAGEYVVTVTLNGKTTTMYYQNKKLAKICKVEVDDSTSWLLKWNEVEGAEKYLVTIECGDAAHQHTQVEVTNPYYDFTNCTMQKGGVKLVVEAVAEGYTGSASDAYYFSKDLAAAATVQVEGDKTLTWTAVENAEGYKVEITAGDKTETVNVTGTSYSLENYTGALTFKVTPYAKGYNSPDVTEVNYTKVALAKPTGVKLTEQTVTWDAMAGATGYVVNVDGKTYMTTETKFDLMGAEIDPNATNCKVQVMATGATAAANSVYSNEITVTFGQMADTLTYKNGKVYWDPVINVTQYAVQINGGTVYRVDKAEHSYTPIFTSAGAQKISVRCYDAQGVASEWVHLTVTTAEVTFDAQKGEEVDPIYQVEGDVIALPEGIREGYTFDGWYTNPNGEGGDKFDSYTMTAEGANLFAHWTANKYKITLNLDGGEIANTEVEVTFDASYDLGIPTNVDTTKVFVGWYSEKNGVGLQYADYTGQSINVMFQAKDVTMYAAWKDAFEFTEEVDGEGYSVKQAPGIDAYTKVVTVPVTYKDKPVTRIEADAFKSSKIVTVNIPDTIKEIFVGTQGPSGAGHAFYSCSYVENVNIYKVEGNKEVAYESIDGVLYKVSALDAETATKELIYFPRGKTYKAELATYAIPEGVTSIGMRVFYSAKIAHLTLPASLAVIGAEAFYLSDIKEIDFAKTPEGQEPVELTIETSAFKSSDLLTKITLPERLANLEASLFTGCSDLMEIHVEGEGKYKSSEDGILLNANGTEIVYFPLGRGGEYVIPEGITSIAAGAFTGNKNITKLVIPNYVTNIGKEAFMSCSGITSLIFEGTETDLPLTIDESAFQACTNIVELTLPANLAVLRAHAFGGISNLKTVTMNTTDMVVELAEKAFGSKPASATGVVNYYVETLYLGAKVTEFDIGGVFGQKVASVIVDEANENIEDQDGVLYDKAISRIIYYPHGRTGAYVTPETLKEIGANVFKAHAHITSVTIGKNVTSIGNGAFESCTKLTEVIFEEGGTEELVLGERVFYAGDFTKIVIPERVKVIPKEAFMSCSYLAEVTLPTNLKEIADGAFRTCNDLVNLHIPASVTKIGMTAGNAAFYYCEMLSNLTVAAENPKYMAIGGVLYEKDENGEAEVLLIVPRGVAGVVTVPNTVNEVYANAMYYNSNVTEVKFGTIEGDLTIGANAFYYCAKLEKVTLPEGLSVIGAQMFYMCDSLREVVIPSTVTSIKNQAFGSCDALAKVTFAPTPAGQEEVPLTFEDASDASNSVFYNCPKLTEFTFPERTVYIGAYTFGKYSDQYGSSYGSSLAKIHIPAKVETIGKYAFYYAPLKELTFAEGSKLKAISDYAFYQTEITEVTIPEGVETIGSEKDAYGSVFAYNYKLKKVSLPSTLKELNGNTFNYCKALETVNFPNGCNLTTIGQNAFNTCTSLKAFEIPATIEYIGNSAFYGCSKLEEVTFAVDAETGKSNLANMGTSVFQGTAITKFVFPETVDVITLPSKNMNIFNGCKQLKEVHLSSTVAIIDNMFVNCPALVRVTIAEGSENFANHETLPIITNLTGDAIRYIYGELTGEFVIPEGYTTISPRAFEGQNKVTKIVIPASMQTIGDYAFTNCAKLETVEFAENSKLTNLGTYTFQGCAGMKTITLPDSVTTIGKYTFSKCYALETVNLGNAVTEIGDYAFQYTDALKKVDLPETLTKLGSNAFNSCGIEELTIPANFNPTSQSSTNSYFKSCHNLKTVTFPEGYKIIVNSMFNDCIALEEIKIPESATIIGSSAFYGCTALKKVDLTGCVNLTKIDGSAFARTASLETIDLSGCTKLAELGASVFAAGTSSTGSASSDTQVFTVTYPSGLKSIVLPDSVTKVGASVFDFCEKLESVTLPNNPSFTTLGNTMFRGCISLKEINLPDSLTFLGTSTFQESGLEKVTIPAGVTQLGNSATACALGTDAKTFYKCLALKEVTFHENFKKVGQKVFYGCTNLTTLNNTQTIEFLGNSAFRKSGITSIDLTGLVASGETSSSHKTIGTYVFEGCTNLTEVKIPNLQRFGNYMFQNCTALEKIEAPAIGKCTTTATYGTYVFAGCTNLNEVTLDATLKYIPNYMFDGCTALETITLPASLTTIGNYAFRNTGLKAVELPANVTTINTYAFFGSALETMNITAKVSTIGDVAFGDCQNLKAFTVDAGNKSFQSVQGALAKGATLVCYPAGADYVETLNLPTGTVIGKYAFYGCDNIKTVVVPEGTTTLGQYAFAYFLGEEVVLPTTLKTFSTYVFQNASNLKKVNIPEGVTTLTSNLFNGAGIESIEIPASVTDLSASYIFANTNLKSIVIPETVLKMGSSATAYTYTFDGCEYLESVTLPSSVTIVYSYMFRNCTALKEVKFMGEITAIKTYAFQGCTSLTEFTVPETVTEIGNYAFSAAGLKEITIPGTVTTLGTNLFLNSVDLEKVVLEEGIATITTSMFQGCTALKEVVIPSTVTKIDGSAFKQAGIGELKIPETVTTFGASVFVESGFKKIEFTNGYATYGATLLQNSTNLETVILPEGLVDIKSSMFSGCTNLKNINLPSTLTTINGSAFLDCTSLENIVIPEGVTYIGANTFKNCTGIKSIVIPASVVNMYGTAFSGWTADQTIYICGDEAECMATWAVAWSDGCEANIVWNYQPQA